MIKWIYLKMFETTKPKKRNDHVALDHAPCSRYKISKHQRQFRVKEGSDFGVSSFHPFSRHLLHFQEGAHKQ